MLGLLEKLPKNNYQSLPLFETRAESGETG
jgi:hypothetical protein